MGNIERSKDQYAPGTLADMVAQRDFWRRAYGQLESEEREARQQLEGAVEALQRIADDNVPHPSEGYDVYVPESIREFARDALHHLGGR